MTQNIPTPPNQEVPTPKTRYKKRVKKVTPTEGLLSNSDEETKKVSLYDPYTGEPNPNYQILTGIPNPLLTNKSLTIDDVAEKVKKASPTINKINKFKPTKEFLDVKTNNKFLVIFPKEFNIKPTFVKHIQRPKIFTKIKKFLGINFKRKTEISSIDIEMVNFIDKTNLNVKINEIFQANTVFNIKIQIINGGGLVIEEMELINCYISEILPSSLSYNDDSPSTTTIKLNPSTYSIK
jgi:hypothetical protein